MEIYTSSTEKPKVPSLAEIPAIEESRNLMIAEKQQLKELVEQPLLEACEELYDKNVRTLSTSANQKDIEAGEAYVIIDFDSLSEENKQIAQQYAEPIDYDGKKAIKIITPVNEATTPKEISQQSKRIAGTFQKQTATWIPKYTLAYLKKAYGIAPEDTRFDDPSAWEGFYCDSKNNLFYMSEEHFKKANEEISS